MFWIHGTEKEWWPFVNNRVRQIRGLVNPDHWNHHPGTSNLADLPSRGVSALELLVNPLWQHGPAWLRARIEPSNKDKTMPTECRSEPKTQTHDLISVEASIGIEFVTDLSRYSSLARLLRITTAFLRAVRKFKSRRSGNKKMDHNDEHAETKCLWVNGAQKELSDLKI